MDYTGFLGVSTEHSESNQASAADKFVHDVLSPSLPLCQSRDVLTRKVDAITHLDLPELH